MYHNNTTHNKEEEARKLIHVSLAVHDTHETPFSKMVTGEEYVVLKGKKVDPVKHRAIHEAIGDSPVIWFAAHTLMTQMDEESQAHMRTVWSDHPNAADESRYGSFRLMFDLPTLFEVVGQGDSLNFLFLGTERYTAEHSHPILVTRKHLNASSLDSSCLYTKREDNTFDMNFREFTGGEFDHFEFCVEAEELRFKLYDQVRLYRVTHENVSCINNLGSDGRRICSDKSCFINKGDEGPELTFITVSQLAQDKRPVYFESRKIIARIALKLTNEYLVISDNQESAKTYAVVKICAPSPELDKLQPGDEITISDFYRVPMASTISSDTFKVLPDYILVDRIARVSLNVGANTMPNPEESNMLSLLELPPYDFKWNKNSHGIEERDHTRIESYSNEATLNCKLDETQELVLQRVIEEHNVFITGRGGVGKSFLLKRLVAELRKRNRTYRVVSSTGISSSLIEGSTIHSLAGINCERVASYDLWQKIETLFIDEISMLGYNFMKKLDKELRAVRESAIRWYSDYSFRRLFTIKSSQR